MTIFQSHIDITTEIAERIVTAISVADFGAWTARVDHDGSAVSASQYVDVVFEDEDGEETSRFCVRISDHEARSYNRIGDYNIGFAIDGNVHVIVPIREVIEQVEHEITVTDVDDNDNLIDRVEIDVEDEFRGVEADVSAIEAAVSGALASLRRFFIRETEA